MIALARLAGSSQQSAGGGAPLGLGPVGIEAAVRKKFLLKPKICQDRLGTTIGNAGRKKTIFLQVRNMRERRDDRTNPATRHYAAAALRRDGA
eukprot:COSAG06_NODE_2278_length_7189_cov_15.630324_2_plen_93_part_00